MNKITNFKKQNLLKEGFRGFNLNYFKNITKLDSQIGYANKFLPKLGEGSSRITFRLGTKKVLKIIKPDEVKLYTNTQNKQEVDIYTNPKVPKKLLAKIYDFDDENFYWLISEIVPIISDNKQILNKFNVTDDFLKDFYHMIFLPFTPEKSFYEKIIKIVKFYNSENKTKIKLNDLDIKLLESIYELSNSGLEDLIKLEQWGLTHNNNLVLVDYGINVL